MHERMRRPAGTREPKSSQPENARAAHTTPGNAGGTQLPFGNQALIRMLRSAAPHAGASTASLPVSQPTDAAEREANTMADRALSGAVPPTTTTAPLATTAPALAAGRPLDRAARDHFEARFGADFSSVRIHDDGDAQRAATGLRARAFTIGPDISFARGQYAPESASGRRLLAHELAHVVQQASGVARGRIQREPDDQQQQQQVLSVPVEYTAYDPQSPAWGGDLSAAGQSLGYWLYPPTTGGGAFCPAWTRKGPWSSTPGKQPSGDWILERYAGESSFLGRSLGRDLQPRWSNIAERFDWKESVSKMLAEEMAVSVQQAGSLALSVPDILRRANSGLSITAEEAALVQRVASLHAAAGMFKGSPFLSTTARPGLSTALAETPRTFLSERPYVVQVRVDESAVIETNLLPDRPAHLLDEQEFLVSTDLRGRVIAVQPNPTSLLARAEPVMRWGGRALIVYGLYSSISNILDAPPELRNRVIAHEVGSTAGGFGGAAAGAGACVATGFATGGVGLFLCGLGGGVVGSEVVSRIVDLPWAIGDAVEQLGVAAGQIDDAVRAAGNVSKTIEDAMFVAPVLRSRAMLDPGNWDLRWLPKPVARDVSELGLAVWAQLGPLSLDDLLGQVTKPVGAFGVPVDAAQRVAQYLSGPDQIYYAQNPPLSASIGPSPQPPVNAGVNLLEMPMVDVMQKLSERKLAFLQDPNYLAGYASRLEANPMIELRLRELIRVHEMLDPDNWSFPGKTHDQYAPALNLALDVWGQLGQLDEADFTARYEAPLGNFGFPDWVFTYAAKAFAPDSGDLTPEDKAMREEDLADLAQNLTIATPEEFANLVQSYLDMQFVHDPQSEAYAAIERVRNGMQPW